MARVTIVVVTYNSADVLGDCLDSIQLHAKDCRVIVVDNASSDTSVQIAETARFCRVIRSGENEGFAKANNRALRIVDTEFALVLNPDARLTPITIPELLAASHRREDGAAFGPRTVYGDGRLQVSFGPDLSLATEYGQRRLVKGVKAGDPDAIERLCALTRDEHEVDWVSGSCVLLRMSVARLVGFFDERYFLYEEDADLCLRLRKAGGWVVFVPQATVIHELGTSMAKASNAARNAYDASHRLYYQLHRGLFERMILNLLVSAARLFRSD